MGETFTLTQTHFSQGGAIEPDTDYWVRISAKNADNNGFWKYIRTPAVKVPLVSNIGQHSPTSTSLTALDIAGQFTTGSSALGYTLKDVEVDFGAAPTTVSVKLATGTPGNQTDVATLTSPASLTSGVNTFTAPDDTTLSASTTYLVVITGTTGSVSSTNSNSEDSGGQTGFSIGDGSHVLLSGSTTWTTRNSTFRFRVNGLVKTATAPAKPAVPTVVATSPVSLKVSWAEPSHAGPSGTIDDYDVRWYQGTADPSSEADWVEEGETNGPPDPGTATSVEITGLTANKPYRVQVRAHDTAEGPWSDSGTATTQMALAGSGVLVSNIGQTDSGTIHCNLASVNCAQTFGTGAAAEGYTVGTVDLDFADAPSGVTVKLVAVLDTPGSFTEIATLANPANLAAGNNVFTAPAGTHLRAGTFYWVQVTGTAGNLSVKTATAEDAGGQAGWSVSDNRRTGTASPNAVASWSAPGTTTAGPLGIRVNGVVRDTTAPLRESAVIQDGSGAYLSHLFLNYNEDLRIPNAAGARQFTATADGDALTISSIGAPSRSNPRRYVLLISERVSPDAMVTVSYAKGSFPEGIQDPRGNLVLDFGPVTVTNEMSPGVSAVGFTTSPSDGVYGVGDNIDVSLTFNTNVTVDTTSGTPGLKIKFAAGASGVEKAAGYQSGSGSKVLVFRYTVAASDASDGVAVVEDSLALNGGTIKGRTSDVDALLGHDGIAHDAGHRVDGVAPTLTEAVNDGRVVALVYSEDLDPASAPVTSQFQGASRVGATTATVNASGVRVVGNRVEVTLFGTPVAGETLLLAYDYSSSTSGNKPIQDVAGNDAATFAGNANRKTARAVSSPEFTAGASTTLSIDENNADAASVGTVAATDTDGSGTLKYFLGGVDAATFTINSSTGQIKVASGVTLNREAKASYAVTAHVSDSEVWGQTAAASSPPATVVANTGRPASGTKGFGLITSNSNTHEVAQVFTTGDHGTGYTLSTIGVHISSWNGHLANATAGIWSTTAAGLPDSLLYTLTNPAAAVDAAVNTFTAPAGATLSPDTAYALVLGASAASGLAIVSPASDGAEDGGAAAGWSIADVTHSQSTPDGLAPLGWVRNLNRPMRVSVDASPNDLDDSIAVTVDVGNVNEPPTAKPAGLTATTTSRTMTVGWTAVAAAAGGPAVNDYDVRYFQGSADPSNAADWVESGENGGHDHVGPATTSTIMGLEPGTAYRAQVRANSADGPGPWSDSVGATTGTDPGIVLSIERTSPVGPPHSRVAEGSAATFTITAERDKTENSDEVTLQLAVQDTSTATSGTDYNALTSLPSITIAQDVERGSATVSITAKDDNVDEGDGTDGDPYDTIVLSASVDGFDVRPLTITIIDDDPRPEFESAEVDGDTLTITFSVDLDGDSVPAPGAFTVTVAGSRRNVAAAGVAVADKTVTLTLASAVTAGQTVKVRYTKPSTNPLQNPEGNDVETFTDQSVAEKTLRAIETVALVSKPRASHGGALKYGAGQNIVVAVTWEDEVSWDVNAASAGIRVILTIGSNTGRAELVTDGATSGTAKTLWFSYTTVSGDVDADGVEVTATSAGKLVRLRSGATLKDADDSTRNAGVDHAGLSAQSDHKVAGSATPGANVGPAFSYDLDGDSNTPDSTVTYGVHGGPSGTLISVADDAFTDANGDTLRFTVSPQRPDAVARNVHINGQFFIRPADDCPLEDLLPALPLNDDGTFHNVVTITATDPDGATVSATWTISTGWVCRELKSAVVDTTTLTLTYDGLLPDMNDREWFLVLDADSFTVKVDGTEVELAQTNPLSVGGSAFTLSLAEAVTPPSVVTVSYEPAGRQRVRGLIDQAVTNTTLMPTGASVNGLSRTLTITFNTNLEELNREERREIRYAFSVTGLYWNGVPLIGVVPELATVSGKTVTLLLPSSVSLGKDVAVSYYGDEAGDLGYSLTDTNGNEVPAFFHQTATNSALGTAPLLLSGRVEGTALTLTFDTNLDSSSTPSGDRFIVSAYPAGYYVPESLIRGTGTATVSGAQVTVALASAVTERSSASVWFRPGTEAAQQLRSSTSGQSAPEIYGSIISVLDQTSPTLESAFVAGTKLILYYSEKLDATSEPATTAFAVTVAGSARGVSSVTMREDAVELTLASSAAATETVTVAYTVPTTSPIQDLAGNDAAAVAATETVTNAGPTDPGKPTLATTSPAVADDIVVTLTFTQALDPAAVPSANAFSFSNTYMRVVGVAVRGTTVVLDVSPGFYACADGITVTYTKPSSNPLRNVWGTQADGFSNQAATNANTSRCTLYSPTADVGGDSGSNARRSMNLRFDRPLNRLRAPSTAGFTVTATTPQGEPAAAVEVSDVQFARDAAQLQLELSRDLAPGERLTASYRQPRTGAGLWDSAGNQIAPFTAAAVVAASVPTVTAVEVTSDAGDHDTYAMAQVISVRLTFSEAVAVTGTPLVGIDMDPAHWGRKDAVYASGSGTAELIFTHTVVEPNYSTQGIAVLADTLSLDGGTIQSVSSQTDAELSHAGLGHDPEHKVDWRQLPPDANGNRPLVYRGTSQTLDGAEPGYLVSLEVSADDFVNPDGGTLTFTLSASRDDVYVPGGLSYNETIGRVFFQVKTACALVGLDPPESDAYYTVVTVTATNPDGATAHATATFRTDASRSVCPSLSSAAVDGATLTITLDDDAASSFERATVDEFVVKVDGAAVSLAGAGADAVSVSGTTIELTLASPVSAGQTVTVSYTPGDNPIAAVFTDQPVTNNTPAPDDPPGTDDPAEDEPAEDDPASEPSVLIGAAVSGKELTLTFNQDLAAMDAAAAGSLRWSFLVDGAFYLGAAVRNQSPARVVTDGATVTLTLGTAILPGVEATVRYFAGASGNGLQFADGTAIADFATTLTTTQRD